MGWPPKDLIPPSNVLFNRVAGAACVSFGAFIALTSVAGAVIGVLAWNGWLAIAYGILGLTMGVAGAAGVWTPQPLRSALFGWSFVGIASRAILEGGVHFWLVSIPVAAVLLSALAFELVRRPSVSGSWWAFAGAGLALYSLFALAYLAPNLPPICLPFPDPGRSAVLVAYPPGNPPWDSAERKYQDYCFRASR